MIELESTQSTVCKNSLVLSVTFKDKICYSCHLRKNHSRYLHSVQFNHRPQRRERDVMFQNIDLITRHAVQPESFQSFIPSNPFPKPESPKNTFLLELSGTFLTIMELLLHSNKRSFLFKVIFNVWHFP